MGRRKVAWATAWALTATLVWAATPSAVAIVGAQEPEAPSYDEQPVEPLPSSAAPSPSLETPVGDFSEPPLEGAEGLIEAAQREESFDPEESVQVEGQTTATRAVFDNPDGTQTAVVSAEPVRFEEGGEWREIDLDLVEGTDGQLEPEASPSDVVVPSDPSDGIAVHESSSGAITVGVPSVVEAPATTAVEVSGVATDQAVVEGDDGVTSVVTPLSNGFEHDVVFPARAVASPSFTVDLSVPAGVLAAPAEGGIGLFDGLELVSRYGGGVAFDATGQAQGGRETPVLTELVGQTGGTVTARVSIDTAWLADPTRAFPVTIDPTYTSVVGVNGGGDTYVNSAQPSVGYSNATDLRVGRATDGSIYRTFLGFGLSGVPSGALILDAQMELHNIQSTNCTPSLVRTRHSSSPLSTWTWTTQPGVGNIVVDANYAHGATGCVAAWQPHDVTDAVTDWYDGSASNNGFRLSADEATTAGYKRFSSSQSGSATAPRLVVTYDRIVPAPAFAAPADGATVTSLAPTLSVNPVTDPDGEAVTYWFRAWTGDGLPYNGQVVSSGWLPATSWAPPEGAFQDGVTYTWAVWARGGTGLARSPIAARTVSVDRRLDGDPAPTDGAGPVSVNLVTGDASYSTASPGVSTLGGQIAPGYSYHSQRRPQTGLSGEYFRDANANAIFDDGPAAVQRTDSVVSFDWSERPPFDALTDEQYLVRWKGFITVPRTATYYFGGHGSNGYKVTVNGTTVVNRWPGSFSISRVFGFPVSLTAGQTVPVTVEMVDSIGYGAWISLAYKDDLTADAIVPTSWLTPEKRTAGELSSGWELDLGGSAPVWEAAQVTNDAITLIGADGTADEFQRLGAGGYTGPDGRDVTVALTTTGGVTVHDGTTTYTFAADGTLATVTDGPETDSTSPTYTWSTVATGGVTYRRITAITDPVSNRSVNITWNLPGSSCPAAPTYFDPSPPVGALCKLAYWDGSSTTYGYSSGQLSRIVDPGGSTTDFGYDSNGLLATVRDPLAYDTVARGVRWNDSTTRTAITYTAGKATKVTLPAPLSGAERPETTFIYGAGTTDTAVAGATGTAGYTRRVAFDPAGRLTSETDAGARTSTSEWSPAVDEEVLSTTDHLGLKTTMHYDADGEMTDVYGPSPSAWFGSDRRPLAAHVADTPHEKVSVDEGITGLTTTWFASGDLSGPPISTAVTTGGSWPTSPTGSTPFSGRLTGTLTFPTAGTYSFGLTKSGAGRLWVDDALAVDGWTTMGNVTGTATVTVAAGESRRIRADYTSPTSGTPSLGLTWTPPSSSATAVPTSVLSPELDVVTSATSGGVDTATSYADGTNGPEDGAPSAETTDPSGLSLTTSYTYEPDGTGWQRPLTRTLSAGNQWTYAYYGGTETRDNPCTTASDPAIQGGLRKTLTGPAAADSSVRVDETVYDALGRTVATRVSGGSWTCLSYDGRGRPVERKVPAFGGAPARTITWDWALGGTSLPHDGNPMESAVTDPVGTIAVTADLLGRPTEQTDVWGSTATTTYDRAGRAMSADVSAGGVTWHTDHGFAADGSLSTMDLDGQRIADLAYDAQGRLSTIGFPSGTGKAGNGTSSAPMGYDAQDRSASLAWKAADGSTMMSDAVGYDSDGRVVDQTIDGTDATASGPSFTYDAAGRLTMAKLAVRNPTTGVATGAVRTLEYLFDGSGGCGASAAAGKNTNRTAAKVDGTITAGYCYDNADRLTSTTQPGYSGTIAYDSHGNTSAIAGETRSYDGDDRHRETTEGTTTVSYTRDALDRIVERKVSGTTVARYAHAGSGDSPTATLHGSGAISQRVVTLPGGVIYSDNGSGGAESWAYPNLHGDIAIQAGATGVKQGPTRTYDPYGTSETTLVDTAPGNFDWAWLGQHQRPLEAEPGLQPTIEMGARQYDSTLGRFTESDPVELGSCNSYDYVCADALSSTDLDGRVRVKAHCRTFIQVWRSYCAMYFSKDIRNLVATLANNLEVGFLVSVIAGAVCSYLFSGTGPYLLVDGAVCAAYASYQWAKAGAAAKLAQRRHHCLTLVVRPGRSYFGTAASRSYCFAS